MCHTTCSLKDLVLTLHSCLASRANSKELMGIRSCAFGILLADIHSLFACLAGSQTAALHACLDFCSSSSMMPVLFPPCYLACNGCGLQALCGSWPGKFETEEIASPYLGERL